MSNPNQLIEEKHDENEPSMEARYDWEAVLSEKNPLERRSSLRRTPPSFENQTSATHGSSDDEVFETKKRPRKDESSPEENHRPKKPDNKNKEGGIMGGIEASSSLQKLERTIKKLSEFCRGNKNVRKEIKSLAVDLTYAMRRAQSEAAEQKKELTELRKKLAVKTKESETQTDPKTAWKQEIIRKEDIENATTFEEFKKISSKRWDKTTLEKTQVKIGNPVKTGDDLILVITEPRDPRMENSIQKMFRDRFPDLGDITDGFGMLQNSTTVKMAGTSVVKERTVVKICPKSADELWALLIKARDEAVENTQIKTITAHKITAVTEEVLQKMLRCVFAKNDVTITLYKPQEAGAQYAGETHQHKKKIAKVYDTEAIEVDNKGKSYKEVLQEVQKTLGGTEMTKTIQTVRSTKKGSLLLVVKKDEATTEAITMALKNAIPAQKITNLSQKKERMKTFFIRGMDATVSKEEVQKALVEKVGSNRKMEVGEIRPNRNDTINITIRIEEEAANQILAEGSIKVGLSEGKVEEKLPIARCYKCWGYGHMAKNCEEEDRSDNCYRCGEKGHQAKDCQEEVMKCPLCGKSGHQAGRMGCKARKKALTKARKNSIASIPKEQDNKTDNDP